MRVVTEEHIAQHWNSEMQRLAETGEPVTVTRADGSGPVVLLPPHHYAQLIEMCGGDAEAFWARICRYDVDVKDLRAL